jgi:class 3 adenylate cyclase/tetratricopeptide (TPR) repeat protein
MAICAQCGRENRDSARFCDGCGAQLAAAEASREVRKTVSAVFCDVVGSTPLGERLDAEVLRSVMRRYFAEMRSALEAYGGRVEKFIGDAVVGVFGVPTLHEDDALRAVRAAVEMRTRLADLSKRLRAESGVELAARMGVSTGEVVAGADGDVVLGDVGNVAARLQSSAGVGEILLAAPTYELVRDAVTAEAVALEVKGKVGPVPAFRMLAIDPRAEAVAREFDRPLVGRERELGLLRQAFERAVVERRAGLATVLGFPGIGKSRLALGLAESVAEEGSVLFGHCRSYGEGITYWPIAEIMRQAVGSNLRTGLVQLLNGQPDGARIAGLVAATLGEGEASGAGEETFWALRRVFESLAANHPLLVVFEDAHWAEPTLLDLIEYLSEWLRERPVLLLCLARPELLDVRPGWGGGKVNSISVLLGSLSQDEVDRMLNERLEHQELAPGVRERIVEAAQGVPLFVEQMLALLDDQGSISVEDVPPAVSALLAARLESIDSEARWLLERASVEGERFHAGALAALTAIESDELRDRLDNLAHRELIRPESASFPGEQAFRFEHALIRDTAYQRVSKADRAAAHERLADWLEEHGADEELIGSQLDQAARVGQEVTAPGEQTRALAGRASELLASAGRRAQARGDYAGAARLLRRAADLLSTNDPRRIELLPVLGFLLGENDVSGSLSLLTEAIDRARQIGDRHVEWQSTVIRARVQLYADPVARPAAEVLAEAERATTELEALGDDAGVAAALIVRADVHEMVGELSHCYDLHCQAVTLGDGAVRTRALGYAGWALCLGAATVDEAEAGCARLLGAAGDNRVGQALVRTSLGWAWAMRGRITEGRELTMSGRDTVVELGTADWLGVATLACGYVALLDSDPESAEREFARAQDTFAAHGDDWYLSVACADRALALCALDRYRDARDVSQSPQTPSDVEWVTKWNRAHGLADAAEGSLESALVRADTAVSVAEATEYHNLHAAALADRASIRDAIGQTCDALIDLQEALKLYERKGNVVEADRIAERLSRPT